MRAKTNITALAFLLGFMVLMGTTGNSPARAEAIERIAPQTLAEMMDGSDVLIVDVRLAKHKQKSGEMIKGAKPEDPSNLEQWLGKYPKDKTIVFYCA